MAAEDTLSLGSRVAHIRSVLGAVLAARPETMLDLKRRLARELAIDPKPQALQGFSALREIADPKGRELGMRSLILHFAIEWCTNEAWGTPDTDPSRLRRAAGLIPPLIALSASVEEAFDDAIGAVNFLQRDAVGRLHASLHVPDEPLLAGVVLLPEVARLAEAARAGTLAEAAPSLSAAEVEAVVAACAPDAPDAPRPDRVFVEAVALRTLIERDLAAFLALAMEDDATATGSRRDLRMKLQSQRQAHEFVSRRFEAERPRRFGRTRAADRSLDRALDRSKRTLFATYLAASRALSGPTADAEDDLRARILEAEREAAAIDAEKATRKELFVDAAAGVAAPVRDEVLASPDIQALARERRRKSVLVGIAAALVPCALTANVVIYRGGAKALATSPDFLAAAMPVREIMPIGQALYSQVSTLLWEDLTEPERRDKVKEMGRLAAQRGYQVVLVVDESRRERARWSLTGGTELAEDRRPN